LVQQGGAGPAQAAPRCTKCNSPPINGQCTNFMLFDVALQLPVPIKGLKLGKMFPPDQIWMHVFYMSVRLSVRFFCYKTCEQDILKTKEPISMQLNASGPRQGRETINFGDQEIKDQGHICRLDKGTKPSLLVAFGRVTFLVNLTRCKHGKNRLNR